ncbi:MAG: DeoR/GlpR family DNA-binding transcription regulator [Spirochaetota bacterium]
MKINKDSKRVVLQALEERGKLNVLEVAGMIGVSEATARRLFVRLEDEGLVIRTFGGVQPRRSENSGYSFSNSASTRTREKTVIGVRAALEVLPGDHVFLDSGTTVLAMAQALARRFEEEQIENVKVLTNSLILTDILTPFCKVVLVGGEIRPERRDACGFLAEEMLKRLHVKKAFLGCDALNLDRGLMTTDERTARMNEIVIHNAASVYIIADASKIGETSFISYGGLERVDTCITDSGISPELSELLTARIRRLLVVE